VFSNSEAVPYTLTGTSGSAIESNLFIKAGTGTLVLAVDNLITSVSPINVIEGTLQLGNGGTTGTIGGDIINDASLVLNHGAGASVTVPGKISGLGSVTKIGAGTTILRGTSTYMGGTTVDGGVLDVAAAGAAGGGGITVASGTLRVSVANGTTAAQTITLGDASTGTATTVFELPVNTGATGDAVTLSTPLVVSSAAPDSKAILRYPGGTSGASMSYAGAITLQDRSLWIENTSDTNPITRLFNLTGQVSGTGDLCIDVPSPAARVRLSNTNNTFVGDVRLVRGMLQLGTGAGGVGNPIPDTANVIFSPGTRLGMGLSDTVGALVGGAADPGNALAAALINPNVSNAGTTTLTIGGGNQSGDFAGDITDEAGSHVMAIAKIGAGTQTLSGVSSIYTGSTTVSEGTLAVASVADNAGSIGKGSLILAGGTLSFTGSSQSSTARTLTVTAAGGTLDVAVATGELAFTGGGSVTGPLVKTGPGTASLAQPVTGSASVRVEGGTLVLDAACTYSGVTEIVSGGNLRLKGSLSGAVSVANSGVLSGTGVISGLATIANGGIIAPGNSPGRLTLAGGLSLTGTYLAEIATALSYDSLNITGNFAADGIIKVRLLDGFAPSENAMFDLADWTGTFSGAPVFDFSEAALTPGLSWDSSHFSSDGTLRVIPEPSIALLALGSGLIMLGRRRRGTVL
jgi:fibronectin-binding autotransporter adhesin